MKEEVLLKPLRSERMRVPIVFLLGSLLFVFLFVSLLITGSVDISLKEIVTIFTGGTSADPKNGVILLQTRLPVAIAAVCCGAMLSAGGLIMQTLFHNPLAGPSVLGISSGASFGVALFMLSSGGATFHLAAEWLPAITIFSALGGALATIIVLFLFSSLIRSSVTLLIIGLMLSYIFSSGISLLNYFSKAEEIRSFIVWGLGSFYGVRLSSSFWLLGATIAVLAPTILFCKPLNAMLLGERYIHSIGYSVKKVRCTLLLATGFLVAIPTAFCGPIGFIGLIVPHLCRLLLKSSNHLLLIPASILIGAVLTMACAWVGVLPADKFGILPINVITPLIGVPVILYLLVKRNKILYF